MIMTYLFSSCAVIVVDFRSQTSDIRLLIPVMKLSLKRLSDSDVELLIELWKNERALRDVTFPKYSNADERKAALSSISLAMRWMTWIPVSQSTHVQFLVNVGFSVRHSASFYRAMH